MRYKYIVEFDDRNEAYCSTKKAVKELIEEMIEEYTCMSLSKRTLLNDIHVYEVIKKTKAKDFLS